MPRSAVDWLVGDAPPLPLAQQGWAGPLPLDNFGGGGGALPIGNLGSGGGALPISVGGTYEALPITYVAPGQKKQEREKKAEEAQQKANARQVGAQAARVAPAAVPAEYRATVEAAAAKYGVDPTLVSAQIQQESGWQTGRTSSAGAQGVAQFIPSTAAQYNVNVADPHSSIEGAFHYMADLLKQYGGDQTLALVAYNGGPRAVAMWQAGTPFAESQAYVNRVTANQQAYRTQTAQANAAVVAPHVGGAAWPEGVGPPGLLRSPLNNAPYRIAFDVHQQYSTPLPGGTTHHRGVDLVPTEGGLGTPVQALAGGTVVDFRQGGAQGNAVVIQDANGLYNSYFHLMSPNQIPAGTIIQPGQVIGAMGQSGSEGFPHLHLEVRRNLGAGDPRGEVIDPLAYFGLR